MYVNKTGLNVPWAVADREWFKTHKTRLWYVRDPFEHEINNLKLLGHAATIESMRNVALSPGAPSRTKLRVCVFSLRPDLRARFPVLGSSNSSSEDASFIIGDKRLGAREFLEVIRRQMEDGVVEDSPMSSENCACCGAEFSSPCIHATVDLADGAGGRPTHLDCVPVMFEKHRSCAVIGFAVWVRHGEDPKKIEEAVTTLKAMMATLDPPKN